MLNCYIVIIAGHNSHTIETTMIRKLGRKKSNKEHLIRNLATSLVLYEAIETTEAKAKEAKSYLERVIARNKSNTLAEKRTIFSKFFDKKASQKVINELFPRYESRNSGFIRSFHLANRQGDNARMMRLELVDMKVFVTEEKVDKKATPKAVKNKEAAISVKSGDTTPASEEAKEKE